MTPTPPISPIAVFAIVCGVFGFIFLFCRAWIATGTRFFGPVPGIHPNQIPPPPPPRAVTHGIRHVVGIRDPKPINNLPADLLHLKLRFRRAFATAFVFTPGCVTEWYLRDDGDTWHLAIKRGTNHRPHLRHLRETPHVPRT